MALRLRYAPQLDPASVARLRTGRVPVDWLSCGYCAQCGPVLLPGVGQDYGQLPTCPWCLVRQASGRIPGVNFVRARLREHWPRLPVYFATARPTPDRPSRPSPDQSAATTLATPAEASVSQEDAQIDPEPPSDLLERFEPFESFDLVVDPALDSASNPDEDHIGHIREVPHFSLDRSWIESQVGRCPDPRQRSALRRCYGEVYQAAFDAEPVVHRKEGRARFAANTDLRELVEMHCPNKLEGYPLESY